MSAYSLRNIIDHCIFKILDLINNPTFSLALALCKLLVTDWWLQYDQAMHKAISWIINPVTSLLV